MASVTCVVVQVPPRSGVRTPLEVVAVPVPWRVPMVSLNAPSAITPLELSVTTVASGIWLLASNWVVSVPLPSPMVNGPAKAFWPGRLP